MKESLTTTCVELNTDSIVMFNSCIDSLRARAPCKAAALLCYEIQGFLINVHAMPIGELLHGHVDP